LLKKSGASRFILSFFLQKKITYPLKNNTKQFVQIARAVYATLLSNLNN
jgi:hypothetical protein